MPRLVELPALRGDEQIFVNPAFVVSITSSIVVDEPEAGCLVSITNRGFLVALTAAEAAERLRGGRGLKTETKPKPDRNQTCDLSADCP